MNARVADVLDDVLRLSAAERSAVAAALIDSLETVDADAVSAAWRSELLRRRAELASHAVRAVPWPRGARAPEHDVIRFTVELLPAAEQEFGEAFLWYRARSPMAADAFRLQVIESIDGLAEQADMWPADEDGFHFRVLDRFPYTVWYDVNGHLVTVLAIAHQRRRPDYWKARG